ncbi:odorant receptor 43a-like [Camponotus floridanus]|uniref:odorant receptor 43a-like n=1 Tax=Camponotus floridanus TaxID=104421 RepID=UPI000DC68AD1|nr:odorant receptor 43a-like [Camponotus floridanus]
MDDSKTLAYTDLDWAIGINRISLKILGLWPDDKLSHWQKFFANLRAFIIFITMFITSVIPGMLALLRVWGDIVAMADNLQIALPLSVTVLKFIIMRFRKEDLVPIINMIVNDWIKTKTVQERDTMIKQAKIAKAIVMFGCVMMSFASVALIIPPCFGYSIRYLTNLTDGAKPLLLQTYYLRDMTESPYYEIAFVAQATSIIMAAISYTGIDNFLGLLVFHICAQLDILKVRLLNLNDFKSFSIGLSFNIEDHLRLIRSVDVIDHTFNLMLLALLMYFAILFCVQGFLLVTIIDGVNEDISFMRISWLISILINTFVHMCLYCVVGEILIAKGEGVYYAAYNYTWYSLKPNEARNLLLIMIRSEKPLLITAGRIFPMTLSMFCSVRHP